MRSRICILAALPGLLAAACAPGLDDPRAAEIVGVLARADASLVRARPALAAGKYARMAADPYGYYRGSASVFRHDWERAAEGVSTSAFSIKATNSSALPPGPLPFLLGDAHPENFGVLRARDGSFGLEPNDFDAADRGPYLWDLRRLVTGMSLAARLADAGAPEAADLARAASRSVARAAAKSYAEAIAALAEGAPRARVGDAGSDPVLEDLFSRSAKATADRAELDDTVLAGGRRRLKRGALDPAAPWQAWADLPEGARAALPAALEAYRRTLVRPPPPEYFALLDAVRAFGSGVASWPKVRVILLVRGPTDDPADDVMLELKELAGSALSLSYPQDVWFDDDAERTSTVGRIVAVRPRRRAAARAPALAARKTATVRRPAPSATAVSGPVEAARR